jgi:hypothetical protein
MPESLTGTRPMMRSAPPAGMVGTATIGSASFARDVPSDCGVASNNSDGPIIADHNPS